MKGSEKVDAPGETIAKPRNALRRTDHLHGACHAGTTRLTSLIRMRKQRRSAGHSATRRHENGAARLRRAPLWKRYGCASNPCVSMNAMTFSTPAPVFRFVNTNGASP